MKNILLAGNGIFRNHGCEAIARGTIEILRHTFGPSIKINYAAQSTKESCAEDISLFDNGSIESFSFMSPIRRFSRSWTEYQTNRFFHTAFAAGYRHLQTAISEADAVLTLGGDNYSLDYGYPEQFVQFDRLVSHQHRPLVYWGASVGPFSLDRKYEQQMKRHLCKVDALLVRESITASYLQSLGISRNVHLVADPAFAMLPLKPDPARFSLDKKDYLAVNFSITVARLLQNYQKLNSIQNAEYQTNLHRESEYDFLCMKYAEVAISLSKLFNGNLIFVPHVTGGAHCDYKFMKCIANQVEAMGFDRPNIAPPDLTAPEYKWIISQARLFIGARTHSTIAAFSSGVPTISLAYSQKAFGLTRDMYGNDTYCIHGRDVSPENIISMTKNLLAKEDSFRDSLNKQARKMYDRAYSAGMILADIIR